MKLHIENVAKIKKADIDVEGITVIAGSNNTGKSTVGKALFAMFESFYSLEQFVEDWKPNDAKKILKKHGDNLDFICKRLANVKRRKTSLAENVQRTYMRPLAKCENEDEIRQIMSSYCIEHLSLYGVEDKSKDSEVLLWLEDAIEDMNKTLLNYNSTYAEKIGVTNIFEDVFGRQIIKGTNKNGDIQSEKQKKACVQIDVHNHGEVKSNSVIMANDDVKGVHQEFSVNTRALYIKTPETLDRLAGLELYSSRKEQQKKIEEELTPYADRNEFNFLIEPYYNFAYQWGKGKNINSDVDESNVEMQKMDSIIEEIDRQLLQLMDGTVSFDKNAPLMFQDNQYVERFQLVNLSTGLKAVSLLQCVLHYRVLKKKSVLILDEPEINLHPEWQVAYARYIVMLQKSLDLHVVITTHSPFFLKAIEKASEESGIWEKCHYYYAHNEKGDAVIECVDDSMEDVYSRMMMPLIDMMSDMGF